MSDEITFQIEQLNFYYGNTQALCDVNMTVLPREITALIGPSGCGKSTLAKLILSLEPLTAGNILRMVADMALEKLRSEGIASDISLQGVQMLTDAYLSMIEGQYLDLMYQERVDISQSAYFEMVACKTAALMSCATELGALMSNADEKATKAVALYGQKLGMSLQIREDVLDLWGSEKKGMPLAGDILNKKKSLPIIYAIENATGAERRALGDVYFKRVMEMEDLARIIEVLDRLGAREFSEETASAFCPVSYTHLTLPTKA